MFSTFSFCGRDNYMLTGYNWSSENVGNGSIIIVHGMAEHALRYKRFAEFLNSMGLQVYAFDLRGHGSDTKRSINGWFGKKNGWFLCIDDLNELIEYVRTKNPQGDIYLFGHSMGSLIVRSYLIEHPESLIKKAVLSGTTAGLPIVKIYLAKLISFTICQLKDPQSPSTIMDKLVFGGYANSVPCRKTQFDWLSNDAHAVKKYLDDPLCGFVCSAQFYADLINGTLHSNKPKNLKKLNTDLSLMLISGSEDPVGRYGKDIEFLRKKISLVIKQGQLVDIVLKNMRHEILNELEYKKAYKEISAFLMLNP